MLSPTSHESAGDPSAPSPSRSQAPDQHAHHHHQHHHSHGHQHSHMHPPADGFRPSTPNTPGGRSEGSSAATDEPLTVEAGPNAVCAGCKKGIEQDGTAGVVISFGNSFFHIDCFRCSKCHDKVTADVNLLLLADGNPVCSNCSYQCYVCKKPIMDEAIMTGDESYHSACFTCKQCKCRISELVFAKTSQGIYCMNCHNERVAKNRRHQEQKRKLARREKEKERMKEKLAHDQLHSDLTLRSEASANSLSSGFHSPGDDASRSGSPLPTPPAAESHRDYMSSPSPSIGQLKGSSQPPYDASATASPTFQIDSPDRPRSGMTTSASLLLPTASPVHPGLPRRKSAEEQGEREPTGGVVGLGLGVPGKTTTRAERRRSINPMSYPVDVEAAVNGPRSPDRQIFDPLAATAASSTASSQDGRLAPLPPSPLRSSFTTGPKPGGPRDGRASPAPSFDVSAGVAPLQTGMRRSSSRDETASLRSSTSTARGSLGPSPHIGADGARRSSSDTTEAVDLTRSPINVAPSISVRPSSQSSLANDFVASPSRSSSMSSASSFPLSPSRSSMSSERGTTPTIAVSPSPPRQRSISAIGSEAPRLDAHRPVSFLLSDDPEFSKLFDSAAPAGVDPFGRPLQALGAAAPLPVQRLREGSEDSASTDVPPSPDYFEDLQSPPANAAGLRVRRDSDNSVIGGQDEVMETVRLLANLSAKARDAGHETLPVRAEHLDEVLSAVVQGQDRYSELKEKYDGVKRTSARYVQGLTVASEDYQKEVQAREEAEAEVKRLRAQMYGQNARLSMIDADLKRQNTAARRSRELAHSIQDLETKISTLRAQRDMTFAEVDELNKSDKAHLVAEASSGHQPSLSRSLSKRLDNIKEQYRKDLEPLTADQERLSREVHDLRETRELMMAESATLHARNEELADLQASLQRQVEAAQETLHRAQRHGQLPNAVSFGAGRHQHVVNSPSISSLAPTQNGAEDEVAKFVRVVKPETFEPPVAAKKFKWYGKASKGPEHAHSQSSGGSSSVAQPRGSPTPPAAPVFRARGSQDANSREHSFHSHSIPTLRFVRCDHCGDKMWGAVTELRCSHCGFNCHSKCVQSIKAPCHHSASTLPALDEQPADAAPPPPSMFGRPLVEQADADGQEVPVIVTKCILAVEDNGMEYEGIYRKSGGSSQSKHITHLFERGDYKAFDLADQDTFNDISSITSVLKNYFRALPDPLLTHELHEAFISAALQRDVKAKHEALCALLRKLPPAHFKTLKCLMLHLNRVMALQSINLMTARNIGVVFGPTLMRSRDQSREFGDMGGKAQTVDWLVEHAAEAFADPA